MNFKMVSKSFTPSEQTQNVGKLFLFCSMVGVIAGFGAIAFHFAMDLCKYVFLETMIGYHTGHPAGDISYFSAHESGTIWRWLFFIIPTLGGLVSGLLVYFLCPEAEGHGTDAAIAAYHHKGGHIRTRVPFVKSVASAVLIGSGGSGGAEGPIAQIGAGFGSSLAKWLNLSRQERRILLMAGLGAGVGAIFRAPLAGALFAAEVLYKEMEFEHEVLIPTIISSIISYSVFALFLGWEPLFKIPNLVFHNPLELVAYLTLALVLAFAAYAFIRLFYGLHDFFKGLAMPAYLKPALGGFLTGCIGFFICEDALSTSYGLIQKGFQTTLDSSWIYVFIVFAISKMFTTSFSIGSGGSGGVFGPSVVIGASLGGAMGLILQALFPGLVSSPQAFMMVGMAAFFSAAANTPLSTVIMVSEMTGNYSLLVPSLWACIIAFVLVRKHSLYKNQLSSHVNAPFHTGEFMEQVLKGLTVGQYLRSYTQDIKILSPQATLPEMLEKFANSSQANFPVMDNRGKMLGVVEASTLRKTLGEKGLEALIVASDLMDPPHYVTPDVDMLSVMQLFIKNNVEDLLIVEKEDPSEILGMITRGAFISFYNEEMVRFLQN